MDIRKTTDKNEEKENTMSCPSRMHNGYSTQTQMDTSAAYRRKQRNSMLLLRSTCGKVTCKEDTVYIYKHLYRQINKCIKCLYDTEAYITGYMVKVSGFKSPLGQRNSLKGGGLSINIYWYA